MLFMTSYGRVFTSHEFCSFVALYNPLILLQSYRRRCWCTQRASVQAVYERTSTFSGTLARLSR